MWVGAACGTVYGMQKTTIYLPEKLKHALEQAASQRGGSEAELIRWALEKALTELVPPRPRLPLFRSKEPLLATRVDRALRGFGER